MSGKKKDPSEKATKEPRRDDLLWKDLLARFFVPMLHSLLPDLARDLDEKRDIVFLDKELRRLARFTQRSEEGGEPDGNRFVDLLANVPLRAKEDAWVLLHVEVQGRGRNEDLPLQMHRYRGLLEGRYQRHISGGAAILEKRRAGVSAQQASTTINRNKGCRMGSHPGNLAYFRPPATCHTASLSLHLAGDGLLLDNLSSTLFFQTVPAWCYSL